MRENTGRALRGSLAVILILSIAVSLSRADEHATSTRFEIAKRDEPSLIAFVKAMPKGGDLHIHIGGEVYVEYLLDSAVRNQLYYDPATNQFTHDNGTGRIPAAQLVDGSHDEFLTKFLEAASMRGFRPGTESGHDHFFNAFDYVRSAREGRSDEDSNLEVIARARAQNEQYLELMTRVGPDAAYDLLRDPPSVDDPARALEKLMPKLQQFVTLSKAYLDATDVETARKLGTPPPLSGAQGPITVRYIVSASRLSPDNSFFAQLAAGMALMREDPRVVGVNIVAPEDAPFARTHFDTQMRLIDFLWSRFGHPNITLHAGELTPAISPLEPMQSRIRRSIEIGHARRIGHGVSIAWEDDLPGLLREMKQQGIAVEICLTSNDGILGVSGDRHPFPLYRKAGVPVSLNTDDEGINRSTLTSEFVRAIRTYNLSYAETKELARNSIAYSFLPGQSLFLDAACLRLRPEFTGMQSPDWKPSPSAQRLLDSSEKMRVQVRLEQAFAAFEH